MTDRNKGIETTYFCTKKLGAALVEKGYDIIEADEDNIISRSFQSGEEVEVFVWSDTHKNVIKQQVNFCGQLIEWNILEGLKTGVIIENELEAGGRIKKEVFYDKTPLKSSLETAVSLLENALQLNENERFLLIDNFENGPTLKELKLAEAKKRFSNHRTKKSIWQKVRNWLHVEGD